MNQPTEFRDLARRYRRHAADPDDIRVAKLLEELAKLTEAKAQWAATHPPPDGLGGGAPD